jgi:hypothetical protein
MGRLGVVLFGLILGALFVFAMASFFDAMGF